MDPLIFPKTLLKNVKILKINFVELEQLLRSLCTIGHTISISMFNKHQNWKIIMYIFLIFQIMVSVLSELGGHKCDTIKYQYNLADKDNFDGFN